MKALVNGLAAFVLALGSSAAVARQADFVQLDSFGSTWGGGGWGGWGGGGGASTINLGTWAAGDGTQVWTYLNCAASANYDNRYYDPPPGNVRPTPVHEPYQFMLQDLDNSSGFYLYFYGWSGFTGNARILVQAQHQDVKAGTGFQTLTDGVYDTHSHDGQFNGCRNGNNSEIRVTIPSTQLQQALAGPYTGHFRAWIKGGSSGSATASSDFNLNITVANIVRVTSLKDIYLGAWNGAVNMQGSETFCVFSNAWSAGYNITFSSANQSGTTFRLANNTGTKFINYTLQFSDTVTGGAGSTVTGATIAGVGNNSSIDCGGVDNARMTVTVPAANLQGVTPEPYSDTITVMVAAQ